MKKINVVLMAIAILAFASCEKLKELVTFNIDKTVTITVPVKSEAGAAETASNNFSTNVQEELDKNGLDASKAEAFLEALTVEITSPAGKTFADISSFEVYIKANNTEKKIAWNTNITETAGATLDVELDKTIDLLTYINSSDIQFVAKYNVRNPITEVYTLNLKATFKVKAK